VKKKNIIIALVVLVIIVGGIVVWMGRNTSTTTNSKSSNASSTTPTGQETTITYSDSGFSPNKVTVHSGDKVTIKNSSSHGVQFDSDPHPIHTNNPELNVGEVDGGEQMSFTVDKKGTFGYHNHLNPAQTGTIIVE
jgi:plastocyanin